MRLSKFAKSVGRARRCALPGCRERAHKKMRCCGQGLCLACASQLLRANADCERCFIECPFCRKRSRVTPAGLRKLMNRCPTHARVAKGDLGACVLTHTPCAQGHFDCRESHVQVLPIASIESLLARIDAMGMRLDNAHDVNESLKRRIALLTDDAFGTRDTVKCDSRSK